MNNNNSAVLIICSSIALLIVAGVIMFVVWQKNKNRLNNNDMYTEALRAINTPVFFGNDIYDVMLAGQRNDSTAGEGSSAGGDFISGMIGIFASGTEESTQTN